MGSIVMEPDDISLFIYRHSRSDNQTEICMSSTEINSRGIYLNDNPYDYSVPRLLGQLSISSLLTIFFSNLLKPYGQPNIVPRMLAGLILGPSGIGRFGGLIRLFFPVKGLVILDTLAMFGYMFYFFLIGVHIDPWIIKRIRRREFTVGISAVALAMSLSIPCSVSLMSKFNESEPILAKSLPAVATISSVLAFPMVAYYVTELNMVNSDFGRIALSASVISNLVSFCIITSHLIQEPNTDKPKSVRSIVSGLVIALISLLVIRPFLSWCIRRIPEGEPLKQSFVCMLFIGVLFTGFFSHASGLSIFYGPLLFGIAIPPGPPLGSAMVEKLSLITTAVFLPLYFAKTGLIIDIFAVKWKHYLVVQFVILVAYTGKFVGALLSSIYFKVPTNDAVSIALALNIQGVLELGLFKYSYMKKTINNESFVVLCISMVMVAATITPIIRYLYDPSKRYSINKGMAVLDKRIDSELSVIVCVHKEEHVPSIINLLEAFNPTRRSPLVVNALHLIELVGRADSLLIRHKRTISSKPTASKSIVNAFIYLQERHDKEFVSVFPFTSISPFPTMHYEVCTMAHDKRVSLVVIPYHKRFGVGGTIILQSNKKGVKVANENILEKCVCSVAIIVDRGLLGNNMRPVLKSWSRYRVVVLFLGGDDDREALALGARMAHHPNIELTILRVLAHGYFFNDDDLINSDAYYKEIEMDNELMSEFRVRMAGNNNVAYMEEVVRNSSGTIDVIESMEDEYELMIVGRRHERSSPLVFGLQGWNEETQLGVIGDILVSEEFNGNSSILVVQQYVPPM